MSILEKILRAGEGRMVRRLKADRQRRQLDRGELHRPHRRRAARADRPVPASGYADGETLDDLLPEAFATAREAARRVLGQRHFDVQVMGGAALHFGNIAEMKTGEGKTLTCVLPAYLNALSGNGVHIITVNDYLAQRDAEWMGRVHQFLGLTVGVILPNRPAGRAPRRVRVRHHVRHEQRVRLRLPARQHGLVARTSWCSAATTSRSSTRSTRSSSTRPGRR